MPSTDRSFRALLVEDDQFWIELLTRYLESAGYAVVVTRSAEEALAHVPENPFDVAVIDVRLRVGARDQSGLMLLDALLLERRAQAYVVVTTHPERDDRVRVESKGAVYLDKAELSRETLARHLAAMRANGGAVRGGGVPSGGLSGNEACSDIDQALASSLVPCLA